jgi:uncharacterized protein YegL
MLNIAKLGMLKAKFKQIVIRDFNAAEQAQALADLESITLQHVMAESQTNLDNAWQAILDLSRGDLPELQRLVAAAKLDFRDVIYWASLENTPVNKLANKPQKLSEK